MHHFYKCTKVEVGENTGSNEWEAWFEVQFDKGDPDWTKEYPAECFIKDRRTYIYILRFMRNKLSLSNMGTATRLLVGAKKTTQNKIIKPITAKKQLRMLQAPQENKITLTGKTWVIAPSILGKRTTGARE